MKQTTQVSRREFLKSGALVTGGLLIGVVLPGGRGAAMASAMAGAPTVSAPNAWVHIGDDNSITILSARSEMGQGVYTSMPMLVAEELNVDMDQIRVEAAPAGAVYVNALLGAQITGGSTAVRDGWEKLRVAGAQVREMLISAAANQWGVDRSTLRAERGVIHGPGGRHATYGSLAAAASKLPVPEKPPIKDPKDFRIVGRRIARVDVPAKVNGTAEYGIDVRLPGMVYATVRQCPVIGGTVVSFDASKAKTMPGVIDVIQIPDGIAAVADSWWRAKKAIETVEIKWNEGAGAKFDDNTMIADTRAAAHDAPGMDIVAPKGDVDAAMKGAARVIEADYVTTLQAHAPIEPMNFTAHVDGDKVLLIGPTQFQQGAVGSVAKALGVDVKNVDVRTTYLGGGFGRRLELDFIVQAAQISKAVGRPVKLLWTREEDMTHDFYRPIGVNHLKAAVGADGMPQGFHFRVASQSITQRAFGLPKDKLDPFMTEAAVPGYNYPNARFDLVFHDTGLRVGYWRAVSHNMNAFANESFMDELAHAAGQDPLAYRLKMLDPKSRYAHVLKLAAEKGGWGKPLPKGHARGLAMMSGYDTYMAEVVEISLNPDGGVRVHKVTVAADPGHMVNPDTVEAQIQSGVIFGLGAAIKDRITIVDGRVQQQNYNLFEPVRMFEAPRIDVHLIASKEKPGGIGEPATSLIAPAIANAVAILTGKRVRQLPITADAIKQA